MHRDCGARAVVAAFVFAASLGIPPAAAQDGDKAPKPAPLDADLDPEREILKEARSDSRNLKPDELSPIKNPVYLGGVEAPGMDNGEWVIGVVIGGKPLAYPVNILNYHEIVIDTAEGVPFLVCW
jgi:hypothetical protein